jgi:hypothetical protein
VIFSLAAEILHLPVGTSKSRGWSGIISNTSFIFNIHPATARGKDGHPDDLFREVSLCEKYGECSVRKEETRKSKVKESRSKNNFN